MAAKRSPLPEKGAPIPFRITNRITGTCSSCGRKNVEVSFPPMSRCHDRKACELQREKNARPHHTHGEPAQVVVRRHGATYYFKEIHPEHGSVYIELVAEAREGTWFPPEQANQLVDVWGARLVRKESKKS